jgi:hypothetical protein
VAVPEVRFKDATRDVVARPTWRLHLLLGVHPGRAHVVALLLLHCAAGALWSLASTPVATLHHAGGDLHPLLQDVCGGAAIGAPVLAVSRVAPSEQASTSSRRQLLPAPDEGFFKVLHRPQSRQVGALEGGLGAGASRCP